MQGHLDESVVELQMAAKFAPHHGMTASQLGVTLLFKGQPESALPHLERGIRVGLRDPQAPNILGNLGSYNLLLGDVETAIARLREATAGNQYAAPLPLAAALGLKSKSAEARAVLRQLIESSPDSGTLSDIRSNLKRQAGPDFMSMYEHVVEPGLRRAGLSEDIPFSHSTNARLRRA